MATPNSISNCALFEEFEIFKSTQILNVSDMQTLHHDVRLFHNLVCFS